MSPALKNFCTKILWVKGLTMGETEKVSAYLSRSKFEDLPSDVVDHAKKTISDTIACGLGGTKSREGDILLDMMKDLGGNPVATVIGDKTKLPLIQAAQVNCVLTNILDYDETVVKIGHMSTILVPVALAIGEHVRASGKDIINSVVLGCELIVRLREAIEPSEEAFWKTFERVGSGIHLGATVVAGKLLGLNGGQMADALGLTGMVRPTRVTMSDKTAKGMPRWMKITAGDIVIPGIQSAFLARRGFQGDRSMLDQGRGYEASVGSDRFDAGKLTANFGDNYGILRIGFKAYPACRHISATLDAVEAILSENNVDVDRINRVVVKAQKFVAKGFSVYGPEHPIQAQFSIPYTVTMVLLGVSPGPGWYTDSMLKSPKVRELQQKVKVEEDPIIMENYYRENTYSSSVEMTTNGGKQFSKTIENPKGDPKNPFTEQDLIDKLTNMAVWSGLKQRQIDALIQTLANLDNIDDINELTRLLVPRDPD